MRFCQLLVIGFVFAFMLPQNLPADERRSKEIPQSAAEEISAQDEQIEQITREYKQRLHDLEQAYKAEIEQVIAKYADTTATNTSPAKLPPTDGPSVVVFTQFRPNSDGGPSHVLHILTSDGRSKLIPYKLHEQKGGNWRRVAGGIDYTWKGPESSGSAFIEYNPSRRGYSHPNAKHDDLVNASGYLVVGDPAFLVSGRSLKYEADGEP